MTQNHEEALSILNRQKKSKKGVSAVTSGSIMFMIMLSVLSPLMFYVSDIDNLYDEVLVERKELDEQRSLESLNIQASAWHNEGNVEIKIVNDGSLSIDITRVWVIPKNSNYLPESFSQNINVEPGSSYTLTDEDINNYVSALTGTSYYIKLVSRKGNIFQADFQIEEELIDWPYPLIILDTSICKKTMGKWQLSLHVYNKEDVPFIVDYTLITLIYIDSGHKTRVIIIEDDLEYPPRQMWMTEVLEFSVAEDPDIIQAEFVSPNRLALGTFYFILTEEMSLTGIDLTLSEADITFTHPKSLKAQIHNVGDLQANDVLVEFYNGDPASGGTFIGSDTINSINAGGSGTATVEWNPPIGLYVIYVIVDPENTIVEYDEDNNLAYAIIAIE